MLWKFLQNWICHTTCVILLTIRLVSNRRSTLQSYCACCNSFFSSASAPLTPSPFHVPFLCTLPVRVNPPFLVPIDRWLLSRSSPASPFPRSSRPDRRLLGTIHPTLSSLACIFSLLPPLLLYFLLFSSLSSIFGLFFLFFAASLFVAFLEPPFRCVCSPLRSAFGPFPFFFFFFFRFCCLGVSAFVCKNKRK
jgi:hypothetical protein